jgi:hypothetical protein
LGRIWPPERLQLHDPVMVIGKGKSKLPSAQIGHYRRASDRFTYAGKGMATTHHQQFCQGLPGTTSFSPADIGSSDQVAQSSGISQRLQFFGLSWRRLFDPLNGGSQLRLPPCLVLNFLLVPDQFVS